MTEPGGCTHCGVSQRRHLTRWMPEPVGWHQWTAPNQAQILERMRARRAARLAARVC